MKGADDQYIRMKADENKTLSVESEESLLVDFFTNIEGEDEEDS